jgi:TniQ
MRLWQLPARALPVTVRPLGGETVISYCRRLAEANGLPPTAIMRAVGQVIPGSGHHLLNHDAWLNDQAIARLEALSALPRHRLATAVPALRWGPPRWFPALPEDSPALRCYRPWPAPRPACRPCTLRAAGTVLVRPQASPLLCRRHLRWLGRAAETTQTDISAAPEILTAHRRYQQLLARSADRERAAARIGAAWTITAHWAQDPDRLPRLRSRWQDRASKLGLTGLGQPVVTFPEAVALAQILTDLDWRRHVAMVREWQLDRFYQHIARRLAEPSCRAPARGDPIVTWTTGHRNRFAQIRDSFWIRHERSRAFSTPFPEKSQFK